MKKIIILVTMSALMLTLVACSPESSASSGQKEESSVSSGQNDESSAESKTGADGDESSAETQEVVFGKVSAITGNEMDISLAKDPYADLNPEGEAAGGAGMEAVEMVPAAEAGAVTDEQEAPKMQLEYTGDSKSFTIPAGVKITGSTGGEVQMDSIAKGSVLMIFTKGGSVSEIAILE